MTDNMGFIPTLLRKNSRPGSGFTTTSNKELKYLSLEQQQETTAHMYNADLLSNKPDTIEQQPVANNKINSSRSATELVTDAVALATITATSTTTTPRKATSTSSLRSEAIASLNAPSTATTTAATTPDADEVNVSTRSVTGETATAMKQ